ncbi:MAG: hypothetical protein U0894_11945 [Pirellulales bacterium]
MAALIGVLPAIVVGGKSYELTFTREGDRIIQRFVTDSGLPGEQVVLESCEGTPADAWPASSPLQSLSIEELTPGAPVALLVGMAGKSHWSASIERLSGNNGWRWDIACRVSITPDFLGSTYRLPQVQAEQNQPLCPVAACSGSPELQTAISLSTNAKLLVTAEPITDARGNIASCCALLSSSSGFQLSAPLSTISGATTFRWKYRVEVVAS